MGNFFFSNLYEEENIAMSIHLQKSCFYPGETISGTINLQVKNNKISSLFDFTTSIIKIDQYQHCPFSKNNTTKKEIYLKNSNKLSFISFDIIFESTVKYNIEILEQFINSLCEISRIELSISEDRLFCLQKMVEILGFNVNRNQDELDIIYNKISEHFLYIISRYHKNEILFIYSMDSLRQIVIKILNNNNNFIKNFETTLLRPFEIIFNDNLKKGKKLEIVMDCFSNIRMDCVI